MTKWIGPQPHLVNMQFKQKTKIKDICIYADYKSDESYTPSKIIIKAGTHVNDLREIGSYDLQGIWFILLVSFF